MKAIIALGSFSFIGFAGWRIGGQLSADALGMALGILFGVMAGIPAALMVLAARRNDDRMMEPRSNSNRGQLAMGGPGQYMQQPPVIVVTGNAGQGAPYGGQQPINGYQQYGGADPTMHQSYPALPPPAEHSAQPEQRRFRVVGETEEWL